MADDFESTPYDGHHSMTNPGDDWRSGSGVGGMLGRLVSYGNWAGPGNRMVTENADYIAQQRAENPTYDPYHDASLMSNPRYAAIDGIDAAAQRHDHGYSQSLNGANMFGWDGIRNTREADRQLVADTQAEMDTNGSRYSSGAQTYSEGLRGYFGGRVMGMDAVDWAGGKAHEAGQGISNFIHGAGDWHSLGDAGRGIANGARGAAGWLANTGREAWNGIRGVGQQMHDLGPVGALGMVGGLGNVAVAGGIHMAQQAWNGVSRAGSTVANGVSNAAHAAGGMLSNGYHAATGALRSAGSAIGSGARKLFGWMSR